MGDPMVSGEIRHVGSDFGADKVTCAVRDDLLPAVRSILAPADLFSLLLKDVEPCRWFYVSGAFRSAMIVYLGRRMGMETGELESMLQPHLRDIVNGVQRGVAPSFFLPEVLRRAEAVTPLTDG